MLTCDGYKMFYGTVRVTPTTLPDGKRWKEPFDLTGTWLYRPDTRYWYCQPDDGKVVHSFSPSLLTDFRDEDV